MTRSYIVDDPVKQRFMLDREALVSQSVLADEMTRIFAKCWIYVGHSSELKKPNEFVTRKVAGRPVIFIRDGRGDIRCFFNTCRHRGATGVHRACRHAAQLQVRLSRLDLSQRRRARGRSGLRSLSRRIRQERRSGLRSPARFERIATSGSSICRPMRRRSATISASATDYIDLIIDQSPSGKMEIVAGAQEYDVAANWKLMVENSVDDYHLPSTHSTWLNYMANSGVKIERPKEGMVLPTHGLAVDLGNGHFTTDNINFRGRPVAAWIPIYGEEAKPEMEAIRAELVARLGPSAPSASATPTGISSSSPISCSMTGRRSRCARSSPMAPARCMSPRGRWARSRKSQAARARRLDAFLTFYGPGGFATPDDVEALELVQQGLANWQDDRWTEMSRGMGREGEQLNSDEHHLRIFWRKWSQMMETA